MTNDTSEATNQEVDGAERIFLPSPFSLLDFGAKRRMCGICGWINFNKSHDKETASRVIKKMLRELRWRGPDNEGVEYLPNAVLGHRRLSIIDLSHSADQPMSNEDNTIFLVFNGEIYNFQGLRKTLIRQGHIFKSKTDSEVLIHLYEEKGADMLDYLDGMFAFAIWDDKQKSLLLSRDIFGKKPLYYSNIPGGIVFSSELKSILCHPDITRNISLNALERYLFQGFVPSPGTLIKNVRKLNPGCYLSVNKDGCKESCYYNIKFYPQREIKLAEADELFSLHFQAAVRKRLISDVPLGVFLSGGLDSTAVVTAMAECGVDPVHTFSIGFSEDSYNELNNARAVAAHFSTKHEEDTFSEDTLIKVMDDIGRFMDEPVADPSFMPTYLLSSMTKKYVTVALTGDGADETLGGYPVFPAHIIAEKFSAMPAFLNNLCKSLVDILPVSHSYIPLEFKLKKFFRGLPHELPARHFIWMDNFFTEEISGVLKGRGTGSSPEELLSGCLNEKGFNNEYENPIDRVFSLYQKFYLAEDILAKADRCSMARGLEVRSPFLDKRLTEFVNRLPANKKFSFFNNKILLRRYLNARLPSHLVRRKKKGFSVPLGKWIKGPLYDYFSGTFSEEKINKQGLFSYKKINSIFQEHKRGIKNRRKEIWALFLFQKFYDDI